MKFIHTADWHIGRKLQQIDLLDDQEFVLNNLIEEIKEQDLDFIIIAGDLYDRSVPSREATTLLQELLIKINIECDLPIFAISGNHDSRERLAVGQAWFSKHNFYLATQLEDVFHKIQYKDADIYLLPYFEPYEAKVYFEDDKLTTHHAATKRVIDEIYKNIDESRINILVAHTFVAGAEPTDSEREISIGTVENVGVNVFEKFDYVALGHLHNPNALNEERIKYSGSPLAYSFSERNQQKGVRLIELTKENFDEIFFREYREKFDTENDYFSMELGKLEGVTDPMPRIKEFYPNTLLLKSKVKRLDSSKNSVNKEMLKKNPLELIESFYEEQVLDTLTCTQREVLEQIIGEVEQDETN